jgi:hydrogenase expression/formation protein HypD
MSSLQLKDLYDGFRDPSVMKGFQKLIDQEAKKLDRTVNIMEVCGGHTHTIMKYSLGQLLPKNINFIHGPGCPVCIMPKERIDHACALAMMENVILLTLGDMIKVPGSLGSLQDVRAKGADVRYVYSPMDVLQVAVENPDKNIIFFAIGFETTTPMSAVLIDSVIKHEIKNIFFHINHVTVPEAMELLIQERDIHYIDAFIGPSHVSVISGAKIYEIFPKKYHIPVVVSGFEPVDVMESIYMILKQFNEGRHDLEIQYKRLVTLEGNLKAKRLMEHYFEKVDLFKWRGIGHIPNSALKLRDEFAAFDAEVIYKNILPYEEINDHKLCICGDILRGRAKPQDCSVFGTTCKPTSPLGSCMVSSEGACAAYYKYGNIL